MQIELELPSGKSVTATTRVVWIEELPPGSEGRFDVGLEFLIISKEAFDELESISDNGSTDK